VRRPGTVLCFPPPLLPFSLGRGRKADGGNAIPASPLSSFCFVEQGSGLRRPTAFPPTLSFFLPNARGGEDFWLQEDTGLRPFPPNHFFFPFPVEGRLFWIWAEIARAFEALASPWVFFSCPLFRGDTFAGSLSSRAGHFGKTGRSKAKPVVLPLLPPSLSGCFGGTDAAATRGWLLFPLPFFFFSSFFFFFFFPFRPAGDAVKHAPNGPSQGFLGRFFSLPFPSGAFSFFFCWARSSGGATSVGSFIAEEGFFVFPFCPGVSSFSFLRGRRQ